MIYKKNGIRYFIGSEMLANDYDIVIWAKSVRYYDEDKKHIELTPAEKKQIADEIKAKLESFDMKVNYDESE